MKVGNIYCNELGSKCIIIPFPPSIFIWKNVFLKEKEMQCMFLAQLLESWNEQDSKMMVLARLLVQCPSLYSFSTCNSNNFNSHRIESFLRIEMFFIFKSWMWYFKIDWCLNDDERNFKRLIILTLQLYKTDIFLSIIKAWSRLIPIVNQQTLYNYL